eukprot:763205-Hanusia_phi.AAC.4
MPTLIAPFYPPPPLLPYLFSAPFTSPLLLLSPLVFCLSFLSPSPDLPAHCISYVTTHPHPITFSSEVPLLLSKWHTRVCLSSESKSHQCRIGCSPWLVPGITTPTARSGLVLSVSSTENFIIKSGAGIIMIMPPGPPRDLAD